MSLCDKGTGLLETHVQWQDVEDALSESLGIPCKTGPNRVAKHIGEGNGYLSRIALVSPDWLEQHPDLPQKFCVKICSQLPLVEYDEANARTEKMEKMHNSEVTTYELFEKYRTSGLKVAEVLASRRFSTNNPSKGFLIMPFYENLEPVHIFDNMELEDVSRVLDALVEINSISLKMDEKERAKIPKNMFSTVCGTYFTMEHVSNTADLLLRFLGKDHPQLCDRFDEIKFHICSEAAFRELDCLTDKLGMSPVLCHGDLWSTNLLWSKTDGAYFLEALVDWQSPVLSTPAVDISTFICSAMSGADRLRQTDTILEQYYIKLQGKVEGEMPFTIEQLKMSFIYSFPFHALEILGTLAAVYEDWLVNPTKQSLLPAEETVMEKMLQLLKCTVSYYDKVKELNNL